MGLVHGFSQKVGNFFHLFLLSKKGQENVFQDIIESKNELPSFYFKQNRPGKGVSRYSRKIKPLSRL